MCRTAARTWRSASLWGWLLALLLLLPLQVFADTQKPLKGVALVIGQAKYQHLPALVNPANDAKAIAGLFSDLGFNVTATSDRDVRKLKRDLENFAADAEGADVAVVYYSGHGIEAGGENWLVPVDADAASLDNAEKTLVPLSSLLDELRASVPLSLVFLDACRTNPFPPGALLKKSGAALPVSAGGLNFSKGAVAAGEVSGSQGLGSVIGFAAEPGMVALDGPADGNSPYAAALLRHLSASTGTEFGTVMRMVTEEVYLKTQGQQRPWVNETLTKLLYFGGKPEDAASDDARLNSGRRALLLSIDGLDAGMRKTVEQLAHANQLPLDPLYGMLKQLQVDTSKGPEDIDKQLRAGVEAVKKLRAERDTVTRTDPQIMKFTELADRAEAEGAIPLAQEYRAKASARAGDVSKSLKQEEASLKARHLEIAATFAKEAETAVLAFDHKKAAASYALAFAEIEHQEARLARIYKVGQADALQLFGGYAGDNDGLRAAIDAYRQAIAIVPRDDDPPGWAVIQNNLGNSLAQLGMREMGVENLNAAAVAFDAALHIQTREKSPLEWARAQNNLGNVLHELGRRESSPDDLRKAVDAFQTSLQAIDRTKEPLEWAAVQTNLANALETLGERLGDRASIEAAIAAYRLSLAERSRDANPLEWAQTQNGLANALQFLGSRGSDRKALLAALDVYREAIAQLPQARVPLAWATTQNNLGIALLTLGERDGDRAELEAAMDAFRAALEERQRERIPFDWAETQNNLANALQTLGERENGTDNLQASVTAYRAALEVRTEDKVPLDWAQTQNNLGNALLTLGIRHGDAATLQASVAAYQSALRQRPRDKLPFAWAETEGNLANALTTIGDRENGTQTLEAAAAAYRAVLEVETREHDPIGWAANQNNLGNVLGSIGDRRKDTADYIAAVNAYRAALEVRTRDSLPFDWAATQNNLANVLMAMSGRETNVDNLNRAIAAYRAALEVRTREKLPFKWAQTESNLAIALANLGARTNDKQMLLQAKAALQAAWDEMRKNGQTGFDAYFAPRMQAIDATLKKFAK